MKTIVTRRSQRGSVLVVALIITFILGVTLASYLIMTRGHNVSVVRSQTWNRAFALTEAGVEDALAMINKNAGNFETLYNWTNIASLTADNWSVVGLNVYYTRRFIGTDYYDVYVTNTVPYRPTIFAKGTVAYNHTYASAPQGFLAAVNVSSPSSRSYLNRKVDVQTRINPLFNFAMAAIRTIDLNGRRIATDSFDSSNTNYSTGGLYDPNKNKDGGDVVTNDTITGALNVGNAKIKGQVKTGPKGQVDIGPDGAVGDDAFVDGGSTGIQENHFADDMNVVWDPVILPPGEPAWVPVSGNPGVLAGFSTNGVTYNYAFVQSGDYYVSGSLLNRGLYIAPNLKVRLWIYTGSVSLNSGTAEIRIAAGSSFRIYMGNAAGVPVSFSIGGKGIINESGKAENFYYFGLPTNTSISFSGNGEFTGAIYAPNAAFTLGGGGANTIDFVGASVTKTVFMNGHFNFHYDEALRNVGPGLGYLPTNWKES